MLGHGDGSFAPKTDYWVGLNPRHVAIGDFDDDGHQDLTVVHSGSWDAAILLGNGDGSFAAANLHPVGAPSRSAAIGDFNADGRQDLAVAHSAGFSILLGNGNGTFAPRLSDSAGSGPTSIAIGDFDNDGQQDLAVAHNYSEDVRVLLGRGDGSFAKPPRYQIGVSLTSIAVGDFDADGGQDVVVTKRSTNDVAVLLNRLIGQIDILPDSFSNVINPSLDFIVTVALLGGEDFDAANVDIATLRFGPDKAVPAHNLTDQFTLNSHLRDLNRDGFTDLMMHFPVRDTGIACGDDEATLSGYLLSGRSFVGTDGIRVVGCGGLKE
jgi:hypothetical protein